ncbi:MAG TPA: hypothetical protein VF297_32675 [Pyrinomonadaceae bacterium]
MRRTVLVVFIIAVASLVAAGQRRPGIFRPDRRPPTATQPATAQPEATPAPTTAASAATAQGSAQTYKSAIEYQSLMQLRFYENQGNFLVEDLEVVFPPPGSKKATFVITRASGAAVASVPLRLESPLASYTMFGMYKPDGVPGNADIGEPGDYVLSVQLDGQPITTLPFSMKKESSNDPFNPRTTFVREGPWRDLAYFSSRTDEPDSHLEFNWWTSLRELPTGSPPRSLVTVHILHGGQEIGATRSPVVVTQTDWQFFYLEFETAGVKPIRWMTLADLTKKDGEYTVVAKVNGKPFKTYRAEVRGGQLQRHPRNSLDTQPHTDFISPRLVDTSSRTTSSYTMRDTYWVKKM